MPRLKPHKFNWEDEYFLVPNVAKYVKLEDVLALIPTDDIAGPKPTYLRQKLAELPVIILTADLGEEIKIV